MSNDAPENEPIDQTNVTVASEPADYFQQRLAEINAQYGDTTPDKPSASEQTDEETPQPSEEGEHPAEIEAATEETEKIKDEPEPEPAPEPQDRPGKQLAKLIAKEAELRQERSKFDEERKEHAEVLAEYQQTKRTASVDTLSYLKTLVSEEQLISLAEEILYEQLGDDAPDEYKGAQQVRKLEREIALLKQDRTAGQEKKQSAEEAATAQRQHELQLMNQAVQQVDTGKYQNIGRIIDAYSDQDVVADMGRIVDEYRQANPMGQGMTVDQVFNALEERYAQVLAKLVPAVSKPAAPEPTEAAPSQTLRNKTTASQVKEAPPDPKTDFEAYKEYHRRQVAEKYGLDW